MIDRESTVGHHLSSGMTNNTFISLDVDNAGLNQVIHDAALWINLSHQLTVAAHYLSSDDVI